MADLAQQQPPPGANPASIMALSTAYWGAQTLLTANRLGIFDALSGEPVTAPVLAQKLGLAPAATELFLNACVALGLCEKDEGRYRNSASSETYLVSASALCMSNAIRYSDHLFSTWGRLEQALRSGEPPMAAANYLGRDEEQTRDFVYGMHDRALAVGQALPQMIDLCGRKRMLDVGGGPGTYSALLTARFAGLHADVLELSAVARIGKEILSNMGASDRVTMLEGDYHHSDFGNDYDVVLMSGMFHREDGEHCGHLIDKARDCLQPGGMLVISDIFTDAGGTGPGFAALFGLNMMLTAPHGGVHADTDVAEWMAGAGFSQIVRQPFPPPMPHRIVTGVRP